MPLLIRCVFPIVLLVLAATSGPPARAADAALVAAAADLNFALSEVATLYRRETGNDVKLSFGSSGNFARQIVHGGPFEMFMSADEAYVHFLEAKELTVGTGELYAIGRLVVFAPHSSILSPDPRLHDLAASLADGRLRRFAIANPEHAPYGRAAREALVKLALWDAIKPKLILGENAAQAAQFASAGGADGGLIPYSLALSPNVAAQGRFVLLPEDLHAPLRQRMVLLRKAGDVARNFFGFVQQPSARAIFERYGFSLPPAGG